MKTQTGKALTPGAVLKSLPAPLTASAARALVAALLLTHAPSRVIYLLRDCRKAYKGNREVLAALHLDHADYKAAVNDRRDEVLSRDKIKLATAKEREAFAARIAPLLDSDRPAVVAVGLLAATGRRLNEVFRKGAFKPVKGAAHEVLFTAQSKTYGDEREPYRVRTILPAKDVIAAQARLVKLTGGLSPSEAHKGYAMAVNRVSKSLLSCMPSALRPGYITHVAGPGEDLHELTSAMMGHKRIVQAGDYYTRTKKRLPAAGLPPRVKKERAAGLSLAALTV